MSGNLSEVMGVFTITEKVCFIILFCWEKKVGWWWWWCVQRGRSLAYKRKDQSSKTLSLLVASFLQLQPHILEAYVLLFLIYYDLLGSFFYGAASGPAGFKSNRASDTHGC